MADIDTSAEAVAARARFYEGCGHRADAAMLRKLRADLTRAEQYGAPVAGAKALSFVKHKCGHDDYWKTAGGGCMACRAVEAEGYAARLEAVARAAEVLDYHMTDSWGSQSASAILAASELGTALSALSPADRALLAAKEDTNAGR